MSDSTHEVIGVFRTEQDARAAADAASRAAGGAGAPRIGREDDDVASLKAEMREEMQHTTVGAGNFGPFTKEMTKGLSTAAVIGIVAGALLALPLGFIEWGNLDLPPRLLIAALVGAAAGGTVGFMGGGFAAKGPATPLAAERGTTVVITVSTKEEIDQVTDAMRRHNPIRVDLATASGDPESTLTTEEEELRDRG